MRGSLDPTSEKETTPGGNSGGPVGGSSSDRDTADSSATHPVKAEVSKDPDGSVSLSKTSASKGDKVTVEASFSWVNPFADVANNAYYVRAGEGGHSRGEPRGAEHRDAVHPVSAQIQARRPNQSAAPQAQRVRRRYRGAQARQK